MGKSLCQVKIYLVDYLSLQNLVLDYRINQQTKRPLPTSRDV